MKSFFLFFFLLVGLGLNLRFSHLEAVQLWSGRELSVLGRNAETIALGGVSAGLEEKADYVFENPALSATELQQAILINAGILPYDNFGLSLTYLHPTPYGVFGGSYDQTYQSKNGDLFSSISIIFSKEISSFFLIGIRVNIDYYADLKEPPPSTDIWSFGINADLSLTMRPDYSYQQGVLIIENLNVTGSFRNLGLIPWRKKNQQTSTSSLEEIPFKQMDIISGGAGLDFLKAKMPNKTGIWKMRAMTDLSLTYPIGISYHLGFSSDFQFNKIVDRFSLLLGYFYDPFILTEIFPVTTGFQLDIPVSDVKISIGYALLFERQTYSGLPSTYHTFTFNVFFGDYDKEKPQIKTEIYGKEGVLEEGIIE